MNAQLDHRESSDFYRGELFRHANVRVAICRDGIQWLLQRQARPQRLAGARWRSIGYFTTRKALRRSSQNYSKELMARIDELPERIHRRAA